MVSSQTTFPGNLSGVKDNVFVVPVANSSSLQ
jgi:hypothetical protein